MKQHKSKNKDDLQNSWPFENSLVNACMAYHITTNAF